MIKKYEIISRIINTGVVAVLRSENGEIAELVSKACVNGGIDIIEITFSVPDADNVIKSLRKKLDSSIIIGAGTVLDVITARIAILAGADFIVAPNFNKEIALLCNTYSIPYIAGCMTINEISEAIKYGVDIIKLFPADQFSQSYIKSIKAPLPQVNIMVSGGVNLSNAKEWIRNGAIAIGVGGNLTSVINENYDEIEKIAKQYVEEVCLGRNK